MKMKPSIGVRNFSLLTSSFDFYYKVFGAILVLIPVLIFVLIKCLGVEGEAIGPIILYVLAFEVVFALMTFSIIALVKKMMKKNVIVYPVADVKKTKQEVINELLKISDDNPMLLVEVNGDWVDISFNWKKSVSANYTGVSKQQCIYKKLIRVNDNFTFSELDYEATGSFDFSLSKFNYSRSFSCGRITHRVISYELGTDLSTGNVGVNVYRLDTTDITNDVHKILADCGYKEK